MKNNLFVSRVVAFLIDLNMSAAVFLLFIANLVNATDISTFLDRTFVLIVFGIFLLPFLLSLFRIILTVKLGGSIGKLLTYLEIVDADSNKPISYPIAFLRDFVGYMVSSLFFGLGFWWIFKDPESRGWHDHLANTKVIERNTGGLLLGSAVLVILLIANGLSVKYIFEKGIQNQKLYQEWAADVSDTLRTQSQETEKTDRLDTLKPSPKLRPLP